MIQYLRIPSILSIVVLSLVCWFVLRQCDDGRVSEAFANIDAGIRDNIEAQHYILEEQFLKLEYETGSYQNEISDHYYKGYLQLLVKHKAYQHYMDSMRVQIATAAGITLNSTRIAPTSKPYPSMPQLWPDLFVRIATRTDSLYADILLLADKDKNLEAFIYHPSQPSPKQDYLFHWKKGMFRDIPATGALAVISHLQSMALARMTAVLNYCILKTSGTGSWGSWRTPSANPLSPNVLSGDDYQADIFLSCFCAQIDERSIQFFIDHKPIKAREGVAHVEQQASELGVHSFVAEINGNVWREDKNGRHYLDTFRVARTFNYQVLPFFPQVKLSNSPSCLYAYVDNPVSLISAEQRSFDDIKVLSANASLRNTGKGRYLVLPLSLTPVTLQTGGIVKFKLPVRPLPDPIASLSQSYSTISPGELAVQTALIARFPEDFDFDATCTILDFHVTRYRKREDPEEIENQGNTFSKKTRQLLETAMSGDRLLFDEIRVQCGKEPAPRTIAGLSLRVE